MSNSKILSPPPLNFIRKINQKPPKIRDEIKFKINALKNLKTNDELHEIQKEAYEEQLKKLGLDNDDIQLINSKKNIFQNDLLDLFKDDVLSKSPIINDIYYHIQNLYYIINELKNPHQDKKKEIRTLQAVIRRNGKLKELITRIEKSKPIQDLITFN